MRALLFVLLLYLASVEANGIKKDVDTVIEELKLKIDDSQVLEPTKFSLLPLQFAKQFGVYSCNIRLNFNGGVEYTFLRHLMACFDNNAFVTLWVSSILVEASRFPSGPTPSDFQLYNALEAISTYHDKNHLLKESILVFWPQVYNESTGEWHSGPDNLGQLATYEVEVLEWLDKILADLGFSHLSEEIAEHLEGLLGELAAFAIPADFDDTFVNLGFGALLANYSSVSKGPYEAWWTNNTNFTDAMKALKKYAYRPLSDNVDTSLIDPRTFLYMRDYLYSIQEKNISAAFVPTWVQNLTEDRINFPKLYRMPFNVNNVDLTVSTNVVYGITAAVLASLSTPTQWFDSDLQMIYENTTDLIAWAIKGNFSARPDLALTYYPSVFNFYWFTARTLNLLASADHLPFPVMEIVKLRLIDAVRNHTTDVLLKTATLEGDLAYFDDFLGDGDKDLFGKPVKHGEDRICSTAMAVNTLLYAWRVKDQLLPSTPDAVRDLVTRASNWLIQNTLSGEYKPYSAVFSGSTKNVDDLPFFYPANYFMYVNGSVIPPSGDASPESIIGMRGIMPQEEYKKQLQEKHFGRFTPMDFHGYNSASGWPFWSSEPFTYASAMLALTQYRALLSSGQLND